MDEEHYFRCAGANGACERKVPRDMILGAVTAEPPQVDGYAVALGSPLGEWWAYRTNGEVDRVYCPEHHEDAERIEPERRREL